MQTSQRVQIEDLKAELLHYRDVHEQFLRAGTSDATYLQQIAYLRDRAREYRSKAQNEQELIRQTQQELEQAAKQLEKHRNKQQQRQGVEGPDEHMPLAAGPTCPVKSMTLLKERLSHWKEKLDEAESKNKVLLGQIKELSMQGSRAEQQRMKVQRQLTEAAAGDKQLEEHIEAVQQVQQLAASLAEQSRLQDDNEQLSFDAAKQQLAQSFSQLRQQKDARPSRFAAVGVQTDHKNTCLSEQAAAEVLDYLMHMLHTAGATCCILDQQHQSNEQASGSHSMTLQQVAQLQEDSLLQFKRCSMASMQLVQIHEQLHLPTVLPSLADV